MLYGTVDCTNSLEDGEVFIQISDEAADGTEELRIITEPRAIVTRMPCHHPGDVRLLRAVDKPALHHLVDCIVFPAKGRRPHPTEMSGGDLDGDEYWTCWNPTLINAVHHQYEAGEYPSPEKPKIRGEITNGMLIDFILEILANGGQVGVLSRRHLALCAQNSPTHPKALKLAGVISDALDFPKTGINSMTPKQFKELNVHDYPDFMQNATKKQFVCSKALGTLFRQMTGTVSCHVASLSEAPPFAIDEDFIVDGYQAYVEQAQLEYPEYCEKLNVILNTYDLADETELITGCHFGEVEEAKNNDDVETAGQEFRSLRLETKRIFERGLLSEYVVSLPSSGSAAGVNLCLSPSLARALIVNAKPRRGISRHTSLFGSIAGM